MRIRPASIAFYLVSAGLAWSGPAGAQPEAPAIDEARRVYAEAHAHFLAGRCPDAMPLLLRANRLVPSPNSGLLIARCLAEDGKSIDAAARYSEVERDALNLIRAGETRYAETAAAAAKEGNALRAKLGTLRVRLPPRAGVALEIDSAPTEIHASGETTLLHLPGQAKVTFVLPAERRDRFVTITAGRESVLAYEVAEPAPSPPPRVPWTVYGAGGIAVVGLGSFALFGLASEAKYGQLEDRCSPRCTPADRADADEGRAFQTVANVGLVVFAAFGVLAGVILAAR